MGLPDRPSRRLRCGERVSVRLETPASLAARGIPMPELPAELGPGVLALVLVAPGAGAAASGAELPHLGLAIAGTTRSGRVVVAAGPARDGRQVGWVHLPLGPDAWGPIRSGMALELRVEAGSLPLPVGLPAALAARIVEELAGSPLAGGGTLG